MTAAGLAQQTTESSQHSRAPLANGETVRTRAGFLEEATPELV